MIRREGSQAALERAGSALYIHIGQAAWPCQHDARLAGLSCPAPHHDGPAVWRAPSKLRSCSRLVIHEMSHLRETQIMSVEDLAVMQLCNIKSGNGNGGSRDAPLADLPQFQGAKGGDITKPHTKTSDSLPPPVPSVTYWSQIPHDGDCQHDRVTILLMKQAILIEQGCHGGSRGRPQSEAERKDVRLAEDYRTRRLERFNNASHSRIQIVFRRGIHQYCSILPNFAMTSMLDLSDISLLRKHRFLDVPGQWPLGPAMISTSSILPCHATTRFCSRCNAHTSYRSSREWSMCSNWTRMEILPHPGPLSLRTRPTSDYPQRSHRATRKMRMRIRLIIPLPHL